MKKSILFTLMILILTACSTTETDIPDVVKRGPYPEVVEKVLEMQRLVSSVADPEIEVVSYEKVVWADTCLELGHLGEVCESKAVPGWRVVLTQNGSEIVVHADDEVHMRVE